MYFLGKRHACISHTVQILLAFYVKIQIFIQQCKKNANISALNSNLNEKNTN